MSVQCSVHIDAVIERVGQFDRTERWRGRIELTRERDGSVRLGQPTQSGFAAISFSYADLVSAVAALDATSEKEK